MAQNLGKEQQELPEQPEQIIKQPPVQLKRASTGAFTVGGIAYLLCFLLSITPLQRLAGTIHFAQVKTNRLLTIWSSWLPTNLHLTKNVTTWRQSTSILELLVLMALAFVIYGLCAWQIRRQPADNQNRGILRLIVLGTMLAGLIFVVAPALLSQIIFAYADYGRGIIIYHTNPYFFAPTTNPENPLIAFDSWRSATAASGPVWLVICSFVAKLGGDHPLRYILAFRLLGLAAHLLNTFLLVAILRKLGRSPCTVAAGALLYAWNPLILIETCLNGYNDVFLLTFILLGFLLCIQAEQNNFLSPASYLPPLIAFTLAALIQPIVAPIIVLFLILLACKAFYTASSASPDTSSSWRKPLAITLSGVLVSGLVILALYGPFWLGHSAQDIINSFHSSPPAQLAYGSILAAIQQWITAYGPPAQSHAGLLSVLNQRGTWDALSAAIIVIGLLIGGFSLWRKPTIHTLALASLGTLTALLIVTPWFQPSYLVWLVGLAMICLPITYERLSWALVAFSLTASVSAYLVYLFNGYQPTGSWIVLTPLLIFGPPILAFLIGFFLKDTFFLAELWNGTIDKNAALPIESVDAEQSKKRA